MTQLRYFLKQILLSEVIEATKDKVRVEIPDRGGHFACKLIIQHVFSIIRGMD